MQVFTLTEHRITHKIDHIFHMGGLQMIRFATEKDIPAILDIYGPYVLHTAISFEYSVPTLEEFTERFLGITKQFPWLVWEEDGVVLGYAYGSLPFGRATLTIVFKDFYPLAREF